jgi:hypothetical protein
MLAAVLAAALALQLPSGERVEAGLKKPLDRSYRLVENDRAVGTLKLRRATDTVEGRTVVVFRQEMEWTLENGDQARMTFVETADAKDLRLVSATYNDGSYEWSVDVGERRANFTGGGANDRRVAVTDVTVGEVALLGVLAAAEQKDGVTLKLDVVSIPIRQYQPGHTLRCVGRDAVEIDGKRVDAFKWEDTWETTVTRGGEPRVVSNARTFWIAPDGHPVRFDGPRGTKAVLAEK